MFEDYGEILWSYDKKEIRAAGRPRKYALVKLRPDITVICRECNEEIPSGCLASLCLVSLNYDSDRTLMKKACIECRKEDLQYWGLEPPFTEEMDAANKYKCTPDAICAAWHLTVGIEQGYAYAEEEDFP